MQGLVEVSSEEFKKIVFGVEDATMNYIYKVLKELVKRLSCRNWVGHVIRNNDNSVFKKTFSAKPFKKVSLFSSGYFYVILILDKQMPIFKIKRKRN